MSNNSDGAERRADGEEDPEDASDEAAQSSAQRPAHRRHIDATAHAEKFMENRDYYELTAPQFVVEVDADTLHDCQTGVFDFISFMDGANDSLFLLLSPTGEGDESVDRGYRLAFTNLTTSHTPTRARLDRSRDTGWEAVGHGLLSLEVQT